MPELAQPAWVINGINLWGLCNLPVTQSFSIPRVTNREDGHQMVTRLAIAGIEGLRTYFGDDLFSLDDLPLQVSYQDVPDPETAKNANLTSLLHDNLGHPNEMLARHGLRPLHVDTTNGTLTLATQGETQQGLRQSFDTQFDGLFAVNEKLSSGEDLVSFTSKTFDDRLEDLTNITEALANQDYDTVIDGLLAFRDYAAYGQMRDFEIPTENRDYLAAHPKYLVDMVKSYASLKAMMEKVQRLSTEVSTTGDKETLAEAVKIYRTVLRHFRPEFRVGLATGEIPLLAQRDLHLAHLLHLAQDSRTHCNTWAIDTDGDGMGEVCTESVAVNLFGIGPLHAGENDSLTGADGELKIQRGVTISEEILELLLISDKDEFKARKLAFLDKYWPTAYAMDDKPISYRVADLDDGVSRL